MTLDLDAIRERDAAVETTGLDSVRWRQVARDRRDLLAEVDRLRAENATIPPDVHVWGLATEQERARALPVIEAARAVCTAEWPHTKVGALRAALAEYDR